MPIERISQDLDRIVSPDDEVEWLGGGFGVEWGPGEGPVWWQEGGYLLFSDIGNNRRLKWALGEEISVFQEPTDNANGLTRDPQGRLIACEHRTRRVTRLESDGSITVVGDRYQGRRLNRPNDVVARSDGSIYFTDPGGLVPSEERELDFSGVYQVSPDLGAINLLVQGFHTPNGLAFSPDESILYINDTSRRQIRAFAVGPDGTLEPGTERVFSELTGERPGSPDGMKVDMEGNVYCTGPGGVWIIDPAGKHLGTILIEAPQTTNICWGGGDWKTLYVIPRHRLGSIRVKIPGVPVPR